MKDETIKLLKNAVMGCQNTCDNISQMYGTVKNVEIKGVLEKPLRKACRLHDQRAECI